ncbi:SGNH/GDSL hydrolase family protein [Nostoc flagelliforme FACHB-838]|uniref:SGNH/GDSL hydrolase family protein n=1 Tax=Nostoc flagelliforme FACHB-838 TaxID=2692904 RepID=A0ABR8E1W5_9NOSO|nr:SGNH/GDSL hydrolase family protein [Nostoc flagelliforme]MBD2535674.1 SGNH/GDSL hydrolase family protein [Nostoc flagelliforme FACHB-838]
MKKQAVAVGFVLFSFMLPTKASAVNFDQLYVFGDSLSDTGNIYNATGKTYPVSPPNFEGRFSDGPLWVDYVGNQLGLKPTLLTDIDFATIPPTPIPTQGINFAFGGSSSGLGNAVVSNSNLPGLLKQVLGFAATMQANNQTVDPDALYTLWGGANDFFFLNSEDSSTPISNISLALNTLVGVGAKNILVFNLPDLGQLPAAKINNRNPTTLSKSTNEFNLGLAETVSALSQNQNLNIISIDTYSLFNQASALGFTNVTESCLSRPDICNPGNNKFLIWDGFHPTTAGHKVIADAALAAIEAKSVPESSSNLGILALGAFGAIGVLKRQQKRSVLTARTPIQYSES